MRWGTSPALGYARAPAAALGQRSLKSRQRCGAEVRYTAHDFNRGKTKYAERRDVFLLQKSAAKSMVSNIELIGALTKEKYEGLLGQFSEQCIHAHLRLYNLPYPINAHTLLLHAVALADGDAVVG